MNRLAFFRLPLLVLTYLVITHTSVASMTIASVHINLMLLLVASVAVVGGREAGASVGFVVGLLSDAFLVTPFGLSSLVFSFLGYVLGEVERVGSSRSWLTNSLLVGLGSAAGQVLLTGGLFIVGTSDPFRHDFLIEVAVVTGVNFILAPLALLLAKFALNRPEQDRPNTLRR